MIQSIPPEITIASFSIISVLTGYIWDKQTKKICKIEKQLKKMPYNQLENDIGIIKNDIIWIKQNLRSKKW